MPICTMQAMQHATCEQLLAAETLHNLLSAPIAIGAAVFVAAAFATIAARFI